MSKSNQFRTRMALSKSLTWIIGVCEHTWSGRRDAGRLEPGACWHWPAPTTSRASWSNRPTTPTRLLIQVVVDLLMVHAGHPRPLFRSDPQAAVKIHLGSIIQAFKSISFFFRTRSFAVVGLVSSKWNYFLDRLILSVWKGCEIVRCECAKNGLPQRQWQIDNEWWIKYLVGVLHYQDLFFFRFLMWWWWRRMWIRRYARQARRSFFTELNKGKKKQ